MRDLLTPETLAALDQDVTPLIEQTEPMTDEWAGLKTKRTGGLVALCPAGKAGDRAPARAGWLGPYCERIQLNLTQLVTILPAKAPSPSTATGSCGEVAARASEEPVRSRD